MNTNEHLLVCLSEEATEVSQIVDKALRFGLDYRNVLNPTGPTNRERLIEELNDLQAVINMLINQGLLPDNWWDAEKQKAKCEKVFKFMLYAREKGTLI